MSFIELRSGDKFEFINMSKCNFSITDIAAGLSNICRFVGHTRSFYSVAQHSILVSDGIMEQTGDPKMAMEGLMHDASEAFLGDVSRPLKERLFYYRVAEDQLNVLLKKKYHLQEETPKLVHHADLMALATERRDLMPDTGRIWPCLTNIRAFREKILPMQPQAAYGHFLSKFNNLSVEIASL